MIGKHTFMDLQQKPKHRLFLALPIALAVFIIPMTDALRTVKVTADTDRKSVV